MWLLAANGLIYVIMNRAIGRLRAKLLPVRIRDLIADFKAAHTGKLAHAHQARLQEPEAHQRDFCHQRLPRRRLGEPGLQLVWRFVRLMPSEGKPT